MIGSLGYEYLLEQPDHCPESIKVTENINVSSRPKLVLASPSLRCLYSSKRSTLSSLRHYYNSCSQSCSLEDDLSSLTSSDEEHDLDSTSLGSHNTLPTIHNDHTSYFATHQPSNHHRKQLQNKYSYVSFTVECNQDHPLTQRDVSETLHSTSTSRLQSPFTKHRKTDSSSVKQVLVAISEVISGNGNKIRQLARQPFIVHKNPGTTKSLPPIPLKTFRTSVKLLDSHNNIGLGPHNMVARLQQKKIREPRVNSNFLRFYAHDYSIKEKHLLPVSEDDIDEYQYKVEVGEPISDSSFYFYCKLGLLSRERLWSNVILPPRSDHNDDHSLFNSKYKQQQIYPASKNSVCRSRGGALPWIRFCDKDKVNLVNPQLLFRQKSFRPYGILNNDTQYVVRGWVDERFIPITSSE